MLTRNADYCLSAFEAALSHNELKDHFYESYLTTKFLAELAPLPPEGSFTTFYPQPTVPALFNRPGLPLAPALSAPSAAHRETSFTRPRHRTAYLRVIVSHSLPINDVHAPSESIPILAHQGRLRFSGYCPCGGGPL